MQLIELQSKRAKLPQTLSRKSLCVQLVQALRRVYKPNQQEKQSCMLSNKILRDLMVLSLIFARL